jgi:hypothetical protein
VSDQITGALNDPPTTRPLSDLIHDAQEYDARHQDAFGFPTLAGQLADALASAERERDFYRRRARWARDAADRWVDPDVIARRLVGALT